MHNGMFKTLREVMDYYNDPVKFVDNSLHTDSLLAKPLGLNEQEVNDVIEFLEALTDKQFQNK
jgi:cytochrome c peroxidase